MADYDVNDTSGYNAFGSEVEPAKESGSESDLNVSDEDEVEPRSMSLHFYLDPDITDNTLTCYPHDGFDDPLNSVINAGLPPIKLGEKYFPELPDTLAQVLTAIQNNDCIDIGNPRELLTGVVFNCHGLCVKTLMFTEYLVNILEKATKNIYFVYDTASKKVLTPSGTQSTTLSSYGTEYTGTVYVTTKNKFPLFAKKSTCKCKRKKTEKFELPV